ncbi:hypothetical protein EDB92DRAFT_724671 [Lactarius akahatsu]|uniref:Uncharacterized protein n=1 Tax=Lactarius akahatsu TaxID=416441 RepID=A0AAD4LIP9_9AGAM|nr:hypothetical protein EDB92DRAFT_724671 [Lactarius akahatsu]
MPSAVGVRDEQVTLSNEHGEATRAKQVIEQRQRWDEAADWKRRGVEYFEKDIQSGVPTLTQAGREALEAGIKYEHEDENEDGVERDNGSAPAS